MNMKRREMISMMTAGSAALVVPSVAFAAPAGSSEHEVILPGLPKTVEEFLKIRDKIATTPQGGAAVFVLAGILYSQDKKLGLEALTCVVDGKWLSNDAKGYKGKAPSKIDQQRFKDRWAGSKDYVPRSYVQGTSPSNGYELPKGPLTIKIREQSTSKEDEKTYKMFVFSTGADSPRPIKLLKNDKGIWKGYEWSSLTSGVRPPEVAKSDDI